MTTPVRPRVVLGVDRSVAGYAALRAAVRQARGRGLILYAVRAATVIVDDVSGYITDAFTEALGTLPEDVEIRFVISTEPAAVALAACAPNAQDVILVGNGRKGRLAALWTGSVGHGLLKLARCPVIVVPGPEMQRATRRSARRLRAGRTDVWDRFESEIPELRG